MAVAEQEKAQNEIWMNPTAGTVFLLKMDHRGELTRYEQVNSGRKFNITTEERQLNMERAADESLCVFRNGTLQPVRLIAEDEETRELASNPNAMSESDMKALLSGHFKTFEAKLAQINNGATLERMLALAYDQDVTIKRVQSIQGRIGEVTAAAGMGLSRSGERSAARGSSTSQSQPTQRSITGRPVSPG
jgi:hypothetical protein